MRFAPIRGRGEDRKNIFRHLKFVSFLPWFGGGALRAGRGFGEREKEKVDSQNKINEKCQVLKY